MIYFTYFILALFAGAAALALYERRTGAKLRKDALAVPHDRARAAYTNAERIRGEGVALQNPGTGFP